MMTATLPAHTGDVIITTIATITIIITKLRWVLV
jgi:hypothetical protein